MIYVERKAMIFQDEHVKKVFIFKQELCQQNCNPLSLRKRSSIFFGTTVHFAFRGLKITQERIVANFSDSLNATK